MTNKTDWASTLQEIIRNPNLVDRMTSADLKRVVKHLQQTVLLVGQRASVAELSYNQLLARLLEITGGEQPMWSYLHRDEALRLHTFTGFNVVQDAQSWVVCGEENGVLHPVYEYDLEDFGTTVAESRARLMLSHLRQTFQPRTKD